MDMTASRNGLQVVPAEARGYLDFQEEAGLGQLRLDAAVTSAFFHTATSIVAIRYAITADQDEQGWLLVTAWLVAGYAAFRGMAALGSAFGGDNRTGTRSEV